MKIGFISDTHIKVFDSGSSIAASFFEHIEKAFDFFIENALQRNVDVIFHCGDVFHTKNQIKTVALLNTFSLFRKIKKYYPDEKRVNLIAGNHDITSYRDAEINLLHVFKHMFNVIDKPQEIYFPEEKNLVIYTAPYMQEEIFIKYITELSKKIDSTKTNIFIGHQGVRGFKYQEDKYTAIQESITVDLFKKFDFVFLGHFHHHQRRQNIIYISSPFQSRHGDENSKTGFVFFDTKTKEIEFVENIYTPKFITLQFNQENLKYAFSLEKHFIKFNISKEFKNLDSEILNLIKIKLLKKNYAVQFEFDYYDEEKSIAELKEIDKYIYTSEEEVLRQFLDLKKEFILNKNWETEELVNIFNYPKDFLNVFLNKNLST